jgi:acetolactate synthase I/II/III large subunit
VISSPVRVNFPTDHPLCAGLDPIGGGSRSAAHFFSEADALLLIDYDLPYAPMPVSVSPEAKIIYVSSDNSRQRAPPWVTRDALFIQADSRGIIPGLREAVAKKMTPPGLKVISARARNIAQENRRSRESLRATAESRHAQSPICSDWLCLCISQFLDDNSIVVNQTITHSSFVSEQIVRRRPHSMISCPGGSIGWALGAALGAKIAEPEKFVVTLMGDGAFIWGCPESTLWTARTYHAPFLSIIFNNQAYAAIKGLVQRAYGEARISHQTAFDSGVDISAPPDYARIGEACGAFGCTVKTPADIQPALQKAVAEVKKGRCAVVDMWV